jgi:anaerobic selenocysteine-containing dehydrogenase
MRGLTIVAHDIARGSVAAYYPEANNLITLADHDQKSGTPSYKSVAVVIMASAEAAVA